MPVSENRLNRFRSVLEKRQPDITVVFEDIFDLHNVAAVLRTCDSIGIQEVYLLRCYPSSKNRIGHRSSGGIKKWMTIHRFDDTQKCFEELRKKYETIYATHLGREAVDLFSLDLTRPVAFVFGNEHNGISEEVLKMTDANLIIPQVGFAKSLNISVACAVILYEAFRQKKLAGHYDHSKIAAEHINETLTRWVR